MCVFLVVGSLRALKSSISKHKQVVSDPSRHPIRKWAGARLRMTPAAGALWAACEEATPARKIGPTQHRIPEIHLNLRVIRGSWMSLRSQQQQPRPTSTHFSPSGAAHKLRLCTLPITLHRRWRSLLQRTPPDASPSMPRLPWGCTRTWPPPL